MVVVVIVIYNKVENSLILSFEIMLKNPTYFELASIPDNDYACNTWELSSSSDSEIPEEYDYCGELLNDDSDWQLINKLEDNNYKY